VNTPYLKMIVDYCKENGIQILPVYLPHPATEPEIAYSKRIELMCKELGVPFINFLDLDVVDFDTDCYDEYSHMNPSGARKVTKFLGEYIAKNYHIPNQKQNSAYDFWNGDYEEYVAFKLENLEKHKDNLNEFLMLLYGERDFDYEIKVSSKFDFEESSVTAKLLHNLGDNYIIDDSAFSEELDKFFKITINDKKYLF